MKKKTKKIIIWIGVILIILFLIIYFKADINEFFSVGIQQGPSGMGSGGGGIMP